MCVCVRSITIRTERWKFGSAGFVFFFFKTGFHFFAICLKQFVKQTVDFLFISCCTHIHSNKKEASISTPFDTRFTLFIHLSIFIYTLFIRRPHFFVSHRSNHACQRKSSYKPKKKRHFIEIGIIKISVCLSIPSNWFGC